MSKLLGIQDTRTCATCIFSYSDPTEGGRLYCHERSPQVTYVTIPDNTPAGYKIVGLQGWPQVKGTDFCGAHPLRMKQRISEGLA